MSRLPTAMLGLVLMLASASAPALTKLTGGSPDPAATAAAADEATTAAVADADSQVAELQAQRDALRAEAATAPARMAELEAELAAPVGDAFEHWKARLPPGTDVLTLESLLEQERVTVADLRTQLQAKTAELAQVLAGPTTGGGDPASERQRRLERLLAPATTEDDTADENRRRRDAAEARRLQAEQELAQAQQDVAGSHQRLLELELGALRHRLAMHEPRELALQQRVAAAYRLRLQQLVAVLEQEAAAPADPLVARTATGNVALGREMLAANEALAEDRIELNAQRDSVDRDLTALANGRTRLELDSRSEQVGIWLWAELRRLEPERRLRQQLSTVRDNLATLRLRVIGLDELQRDLADPQVAAKELRTETSSRNEDGDTTTTTGGEDPLRLSLLRQRTLSEELEPMLWRRVAALEETERNLQLRLDANTDLRLLMDRHLLWIRSHSPVNAAWLATVPEGLRDQVKLSRFATTWQLVREDFSANPSRYIASIALVVLLFLLKRRAPAELDALGQTVRDVRKDSYLRTTRCLGWTLLAALPWPATAALSGLLLRGVGTSGKYSDSLGYALLFAAPVLLLVFFLYWLSRERGLAHAHFRWTRQRRSSLRQALRWLGPVLVASYGLFTLAFVRNQDLAASVQGRIWVVVAMLTWAAAFAWLLAPERMWHARQTVEPSRLRRTLRVLAPLACVATAWLGLEGHVWSAVMLAHAVLSSVGVLVGVALLHGLLSRWFVLGARRLAFSRWLEKRADEADGSTATTGDGDTVPVDLQEEVTLEKVDANSRALLRVIRLSLLVFTMVLIWGQFVLALVRLDEITLWTVAAKAADGSSVREQITLLAVLAGTLVLWLTVAAARNLPGLIEIGLQSRASVDAASRYAITSVSRYAIVLVGFVIGLGLLGLRWSQLQWMAAALTLGLSFGLQEIFANFVSGLILLFERPFRVGDTITVNNLDGIVTRIRTRATTILDFDNKEIVVPNKSFITGQLINWTLSDESTRVVIKVGVDYGTDPALVHRLLLQAATEHDKAQKDWPPRTWLMGFGTNSLEFELRIFVATIGDRLIVRNEVSARIIELFEANGIVFAAPQLDIHVRELPPAATPPVPRPRGGKAAKGPPE